MNKIITLLLLSGLLFACQQKERTAKSTIISTANSNDEFSELRDSLTAELQQFHDKNILPGFVVSIFKKDRILYQKGFGYSDLTAKKEYTVDNVQIIASITKTLIGVALMKVIEDGKINLDDQINDILPYKVFNPKFPSTPITVKHLATHTSSIESSNKSDDGYRFETPLLEEEFPEAHHKYFEFLNKTEDLSMEDYLRNKLDEKGKWYEKEIFTKNKPGTSYQYSNLGATLLAHLIEIKTGESFNTYTEKLILKSLKMNSSTWFFDQVDKNKEVVYYNEILNEVPKYQIVSYPDGGLYSSVDDLTKYFQEMMRGYSGDGKILSQASFQKMMTQQYNSEELTEGLCWDLSFDGLIGHSGNDYGTSTLAYFSPTTGIGRILFSNISIEKEEQEEAFYDIYNLLYTYEFKAPKKPLTTIEEAIKYISTNFKNTEETLWIADSLNDKVGMNMALIGDKLLEEGYMPNGFEQKEGYRIYRYKKLK